MTLKSYELEMFFKLKAKLADKDLYQNLKEKDE
jgi:hypothetical protein